MNIKLSSVTPLTFVLLLGCGANDLDVGGIDGSGTGGAGTSQTGGGGGTGTGGTVAGNGGSGGVSGTGGGSGSDGGVVTVDASVVGCDPFALRPKPIALGTVLGVGKSASGTIYVLDQVEYNLRVFVSDASGTLVRQRVVGTGTSTSPDFYVAHVASPDYTFVIQIDVVPDRGIRMGVMQGTLVDRKTIVIGQDGEELVVLPNTAIGGMPLRNLPGTVTTEYIATLSDGRILLATRPTDEWTYSDFRLFLGPTASVAERKVTSVTRAKDGGSTHILFDLDGNQADAYFPILLVDASFLPGSATLTVAGVTTPLARQDAVPTAATYLCL